MDTKELVVAHMCGFNDKDEVTREMIRWVELVIDWI